MQLDAVTPRVIQQTLDFLDQTPSTSGGSWRLVTLDSIRQMRWSNLFFLTVEGPPGTQKLVAKIVHFPDQTTPELSWTSEELLIRGQREYDSMKRIADHFEAQPDKLLCTLTPRTYLREINAIVMDYVDAEPLYERYGTVSGEKLEEAKRMMERTGQWLRWFHQLSFEDAEPKRRFTPADSLTSLLGEVEKLHRFGVYPDRLAGWERAIQKLGTINSAARSWSHGDFHMRNVLVLEGGKILGFDTALERVDHPAYDLGKFVADMQTRRDRILRLGLRPSRQTIQALTDAFLSGYGTHEGNDRLALALYEGRFIFQKWVESIEALNENLTGIAAPVNRLMQAGIINPTFRRLVKHWLATVQSSA